MKTALVLAALALCACKAEKAPADERMEDRFPLATFATQADVTRWREEGCNTDTDCEMMVEFQAYVCTIDQPDSVCAELIPGWEP